MAAKITWKFPIKDTAFLRLEILVVAILAVMIFIYSASGFQRRVLSGISFALLFSVIYVFVAYLTKKIRKVEERYDLMGGILNISRKTRRKTKKEKVNLKEVVQHNLDKFFHGGYLITRKGKKHILFFNNRKEVEKFEKHLHKHIKPTKKKS